MSEQAQVKIRACGPWFRAQVILDGVEVATISGTEVVSFPVSPSAHSLKIQEPWYSSNREMFSVQPGERVDFECGTALWQDWVKNKWWFWWARPFTEYQIFRPHLTKVKISR